ncbi:MAG: RIP metalloprotease RseP [Deltaproteobacteria bacterium]|nr:RIP metalloprotease RseP [Deltaproteobacteria bacterium]MBI2230187.1 RIP metalloprotease RseP [Deltaproteobacteria bacterium]MBI2367699.1 RIP metalloprotease RseP [Deltaproteobacteria bacterium]MBI3063427.1 RIP metalloprotease RseP [Deltaproteobacteria bacterium]
MENIIYAIGAAVIGLGLLIVIHEWGHFLIAKLSGVGVVTFSVGFGPKLWVRKKGETEYALSAFPLGGYVKMVGEDPEEEVEQRDIERSFSHKGLLKRIAIVAAGPGFNLLLAVVLLMVVYFFYGVPVLSTRISGVESGSPAELAGIRKGDRIVAINGQAVDAWDELSEKIKESQGAPLKMQIQRDSQQLSLTVQPVKKAARNIFGEKLETWVIGIGSQVSIEKGNPGQAVARAFQQTYEYSKLTLLALYKMINGDVSPRNLGGPIMIAQMAGQQAQEGLGSFLAFLAVLSINLGVLNLLPVPVLDGGHLLFFLVEAIIGRPVAVKHRERAQQVGIFLLMLLMVYAFYNDIARFFEKQVGG